jgi:hypothetical protein
VAIEDQEERFNGNVERTGPARAPQALVRPRHLDPRAALALVEPDRPDAARDRVIRRLTAEPAGDRPPEATSVSFHLGQDLASAGGLVAGPAWLGLLILIAPSRAMVS